MYECTNLLKMDQYKEIKSKWSSLLDWRWLNENQYEYSVATTKRKKQVAIISETEKSHSIPTNHIYIFNSKSFSFHISLVELHCVQMKKRNRFVIFCTNYFHYFTMDHSPKPYAFLMKNFETVYKKNETKV